LIEPIVACFDLFGAGHAILYPPAFNQAGSAFDDVADIHVFAGHAVFAQALVEQNSGPSHKRPSGRVFILAWPFTDEDQRCARISFTKDDMVPGRGEVTLCADGSGQPYPGQQSFFRFFLWF
jgi:hypothetical protein